MSTCSRLPTVLEAGAEEEGVEGVEQQLVTRPRPNSCKQFCCLFLLANCLLVPVSAASLYSLLSCYFGPQFPSLQLSSIVSLMEYGPPANLSSQPVGGQNC